MEQDMVEVGIEGDQGKILFRQDLLDDGDPTGVILGFGDVLEHHLLTPLGLADPLVVGKVEGRRLNSRLGVAGREDLLDNEYGRALTAAEILVLLLHGQVLLHGVQVLGDCGHLLAFGGVYEGDEAFVGGLVAEEVILVNFVGTDDHLDSVVLQVHPIHVRLVVVVGEEGFGP
ncbi:MAG: hypothetical protein BWY86_00973 [Candidatus Aminicenantes bacterium ADurb.Bin508]|nr:MAG: hypothetical protein BWY86_00973 [Candidatus Aminicenantes bacterium ADurb.Bin508]